MKEIIKKGQKYNRLIAIKFVEMKNLRQHWLFKCDCGKETTLRAESVKNGQTKSCGCLQKECREAFALKNTFHGMRYTKTYSSWVSMKVRCSDKNSSNWESYGGRGITVCSEWMLFKNFFADMGDRPKDKTLDRINNNGNYNKRNCRWATKKQQDNNKRTNHLLMYNGKTQNITEWAEELNMKRYLIYNRLIMGWSIEKALTRK